MTLKDVRAGFRCRILRLTAEKALKQRLLDLGFLPHTEVTVRLRAPFSGPMLVCLRGYSISLRACEALKITVYDIERVTK